MERLPACPFRMPTSVRMRGFQIDQYIGFLLAQNDKSEVELSVLKNTHPHTFSGVEQSEEILKWIWENFSAVGGDQPSFECWRMFLPPFLILR